MLRLLLLLCFACSVLSVLRPRGVPLSRKTFYNPSQQFHCLDGSAEVPFLNVNDDFCDCRDGSDEPGTSACPNGVFVCRNLGHLPVTLPSSRINDGICDCCDASDEYAGVADCLDHCKELGKQAFEAAKKVSDLYSEGNQTRTTYIADAKERKEEYQTKLNELLDKESEALQQKIQIQDLKDKAEERELVFLGIQKQLKEELERQRILELKQLKKQKKQEEEIAKKAFSEIDLDNDSKITYQEVQSFLRFDYDNDGEVSEKEAMFYMNKKEELTLDEFLNTGWRVMKPAFIFDEATGSEDVSITSSAPDTNTNEIKFTSNVPDVDESEKNAAFAEAAELRKQYADANKVLQDLKDEIWSVKKKLEADFGVDGEFMALDNQCFEITETRYLYIVCPFDKVVQVMKHNKDETLLGLWSSWSGTNGNKYSQMSFTRGSSCWTGPSHSAQVTLTCSITNELTSVSQNTPCEYYFEFGTPAACKELPKDITEVLNNFIINL